jgi:predicted nucleic acid-binding protein
VERADTSQRRARRATFVEAVLDSIDIVPIDLDVSRVHARIWADLRARRARRRTNDLFIAATALHHNLTIATRNPRHFERVEGLPVEIW